jgi:caa(3)-type oxidase subunit IV
MSHAAEFDEYGHKDHGHVIVSVFTLRFVLIALLFCTLLTSGSAWAEEWVSGTFHVVIPQWINAFVALSIAVVKTALVVGFFMQLKYDNPMNTVIFVFTLLTVFSFLGFTSLDLNNRATIDRFKNVYAYPGGNISAGTPIIEGATPGDSIVSRAQTEAAKKPTTGHHEEMHEEGEQATLSITDAGYLPVAPKIGSSPNASRPVSGVTIPNLPGYHAPKATHGAEAHGEAAGEHKPEAPAVPLGDAKPQTQPEPKPETKPQHN